MGTGPAAGEIYTVPLKGVAAVFAAGNRSHFLMTDGRLLTLGFRMADLNDRLPREVAHLDAAKANARCTPSSGAPAGGWSTTPDEVATASLPKTDLAAALERAESFRALLTSFYGDAVRIEGRAHRFVQPVPAGPEGATAFGVLTRYLGAVCNPVSGRLREEGSTRSEAVIAANDLSPLLERFGEPVDGGDGPVQLFRVAPSAGTMGGLPMFEVLRGRAVLVTRSGQLPFVPVTRGEYLDFMERHGRAEGSQASADIDDTVTRFEAEIARARKEIEGPMRDTVVAEMEKALKELKAQAPQTRARLEAGAGSDLALVRNYRASASREDLARPAVVESFGFSGSFPAEGRTVVRLAPGALTATSPPHRVQLLMLSWSWEAGHPQDESWRERVESSFPFDRLHALLDQ